MAIEAGLAPNSSKGVDRRGIGVLSLGHACVDITQGAVPALLPFFIHQRGYSYTAAAALLLASSSTSSLIQPIFGYVADRRAFPWILPLGTILAGIGISLAGFFDSYWLTFLLVSISGLGVGAYHPEGARYASYIARNRPASGMSLFSVGGNVGFALGPILLTPLVLAFGLKGTLLIGLPLAASALILIANLGYLNSFRPDLGRGRKEADPLARVNDRPGAFSLVAAVASLRAGTYFATQAFVPSYLITSYAVSEGSANLALTVLLASGAVGTLVGGILGDRFGPRRVLILFTGLMFPPAFLVLFAGPTLIYVLMALLGFFTVGTFSITIVLGQRYLPSRIGMAAGVTIGASVGLGSLFAALMGPLADSAGLIPVLAIVAALPLPTVMCALLLPKEDRLRSQ